MHTSLIHALSVCLSLSVGLSVSVSVSVCLSDILLHCVKVAEHIMSDEVPKKLYSSAELLQGMYTSCLERVVDCKCKLCQTADFHIGSYWFTAK